MAGFGRDRSAAVTATAAAATVLAAAIIRSQLGLPSPEPS